MSDSPAIEGNDLNDHQGLQAVLQQKLWPAVSAEAALQDWQKALKQQSQHCLKYAAKDALHRPAAGQGQDAQPIGFKLCEVLLAEGDLRAQKLKDLQGDEDFLARIQQLLWSLSVSGQPGIEGRALPDLRMVRTCGPRHQTHFVAGIGRPGRRQLPGRRVKIAGHGHHQGVGPNHWADQQAKQDGNSCK